MCLPARLDVSAAEALYPHGSGRKSCCARPWRVVSSVQEQGRIEAAVLDLCRALLENAMGGWCRLERHHGELARILRYMLVFGSNLRWPPTGGLFVCMTKPTNTTRELVPLLTCSLPDAESRLIPLADLQENTRGATNFLKSGMRCSGQLTPIVVVELPTGEYDIRDGNRRVATAKALGWTEIRAEVYRNLSEPELALVVLSLHNRSENPVEEARLYQLLGKGLTPEGIAANTGHPVARVRSRLTLLNLPDDVLALVGSRTLSLGVAESAARLRGAFLQSAVNGIREAASKDERYGNQALKEVTLARRNALGSLLTASVPQVVPLIPAAEVLALEVRDLCRVRGVSVTALLQEFGVAGFSERAG